MRERIEIQPVGAIDGSIRPPGSKSITNRALVCAALADGQSELRGVLNSEDTHVMILALQNLGVVLRHEPARPHLSVLGCGGRWPMQQADLHVANSGTTMRFLTAMLSLGHGHYRVDGVPRMRQRPIGDLIQALTQLGAAVRSESRNDCPPVLIEAKGLAGGRAEVRGDVSSQFLSALLLAIPYARHNVELVVQGPLVSQPYVSMTLDVMRQFGVTVDHDETLRHFKVLTPQSYHGTTYEIEPDASAASYFWAAAAITGGTVCVPGLNHSALQGDVQFCDCLLRMGCEVEWGPDSITVTGGALQGIDVDMNAISDTVQTLAAVALFASGATTIRGVGHIRHKETDRIGDLARELRKLGAEVEEFDDGMQIVPGNLTGCELRTYDDHRMAMSLALVGLRVPGVVILDPQCTGKTYPRFFEDLAELCK